MHIRFLRAAVLLLAVTAGSAACSSALEEPFTPDFDSRAMPLDMYYLDLDLDLESAAEDALVTSCMVANGFTYTPLDRESLPESESYNFVGRKVFTPALAAEHGYQGGTMTVAGKAAFDAYQAQFGDPALRSQWETCLDAAREKLPLYSGTNTVGSLVYAAYVGALTADGVTASAAKWRECMAPQGIPDLPESPSDMPTEFLREQFGMGGGEDGAIIEVSQQEKEVAVADATCQAESGYAKAVYDAEVAAQLEQIEQSEDMLGRLREEKDTYVRRAQEILADAQR